MADVLSIYAPGHFDPYDSYGLIACQLTRHLAGMGVYVNSVAMGEVHHYNQPPDIAEITNRPIKASLGGIMLGYPTGFAQFPPLSQIGPRIALTMFESSILPSGWAPVLNTCQAVIVPSTFCRTVFVDCGVTVPVHVIPLGVGDVYRFQPRTGNGPLTFLAFLDRGMRKGGLAALKAFLTAFGDDTNYRLILKSRTPKVGMEITNPNIEAIQQDMTEQELYELYLRCDVLINANMGEGFGLIPREFSATGGIALATAWGGTADAIDSWGIPLPYTLVKADWAGHKRFAGMDLGVWAQPDIDGIATVLRRVADNRHFYRKWALAASVWARQLYSWQDFAQGVYRVWREVSYGQRTGLRQITQRCGSRQYEPV